jgi:hypothetical protein
LCESFSCDVGDVQKSSSSCFPIVHPSNILQL